MQAQDEPAQETQRRQREHGTALAVVRRVHRSILALLAACAIAVFVQPPPAASALPRELTVAAVVVALVAVLAKRFASSPVMRVGPRTALSVFALLATGVLGVVGAASPRFGGDKQQAFVFVLVAALFALRPPAVTPDPPR